LLKLYTFELWFKTETTLSFVQTRRNTKWQNVYVFVVTIAAEVQSKSECGGKF